MFCWPQWFSVSSKCHQCIYMNLNEWDNKHKNLGIKCSAKFSEQHTVWGENVFFLLPVIKTDTTFANFSGHTDCCICIYIGFGDGMTARTGLKDRLNVFNVVTLKTRTGFPAAYTPLFVLISVNGKRQWERTLAQAVNIYSELCAFANLILPFILNSVEMPNVINKSELRYIAIASSA